MNNDKLSKIYTLYFSGTGTTKKIVSSLAEETGKKFNFMSDIEEVDCSIPKIREQSLNFIKDDLVIVGIPVYAGRVPNVLLKYLHSVKGNGAKAVAVVLYGNRNFDDALIELTDILSDNDFEVAAAGAFIGEHSFSNILAKGRPDESDIKKVKNFAEDIHTKIIGKSDFSKLIVSGVRPYRNYYQPKDRYGNTFDFRLIVPQTNKDTCIDCKLCSEICPMGSISYEDTSVINGICIKCCACVKNCPVNSKYFSDENYLKHQRELEELYIERKEPEIFI